MSQIASTYDWRENTLVRNRDIIAEYLSWCKEVRGFAELSILSYEVTFDSFANFLGDKNIVETTSADVREYLSYLIRQELKHTTIYSYLRKIYGLFNFMNYQRLAKKNPTTRVVIKNRVPPKEYLSLREIKSLQDQINSKGGWQIRDLSVFELMLATGIRTLELCQLRRDDLQEHTDTFGNGCFNLIVMQKIGKTKRVIPLGSHTSEIIKKYLHYRSCKRRLRNSVFLFPDKNGNQMKYQIVWYRVGKFLSLTSLKKKGGQALRNSFASAMFELGINICYLKKLLGHVSIASTRSYSNNPILDLKRVYNTALSDFRNAQDAKSLLE